MDALRIALRVAFYRPQLDGVVDACSREDVALLDVVHRADPAALVGAGQLEYGLALAGVPEVDGAVLAGRDESLQVDGPHSVDRVVVPLEDYLGLLLGLPGDDLPIEARCDEVVAVEAVDVEYFCGVFVEGFDESTLREIPLLESEVGADGAEIIGVDAELDAIDSVLMSAQGVDELERPRIPQLDHAVVAGSGQHVFVAVQTDGEDVAAMVVAVLAETDELLLLGLAVPLYDALVLGARVDMLAGDLEAGNAQRVALILLSFGEPQRRIRAAAVLVQLVLLAKLRHEKST